MSKWLLINVLISTHGTLLSSGVSTLGSIFYMQISMHEVLYFTCGCPRMDSYLLTRGISRSGDLFITRGVSSRGTLYFICGVSTHDDSLKRFSFQLQHEAIAECRQGGSM